MEEKHIIYLIAMAVLVAFSGFFSASETAFTSLNQIRVKMLAEDGNKRAKLVLKLADKYDTLLSSILVGNNIVNITLSTLSTLLFIDLLGDKNGPGIATAVATVVVLIFGEISPKMLAKAAPEKFAFAVAPLLQFIIWILFLVNFIFDLWRKLLGVIFRLKPDTGYTEEDLLTIVEEAAQDGGINDEESELIRSAIEFNDLEAVDIFTPRVNVTGIEKGTDPEKIGQIFLESGFSRLPVYEDTIDKIVGVLHQQDYYRMMASEEKNLASALSAPVFITRNSKVSELLKLFQKTKSHMAVIADEFGGTVGIVTMEDVLEELVGEIYDEHDEVVEEIKQIGEDSYHVLCSTDVENLLELFDMEQDEDSSATSVGGWVLEQCSQIPKEGDEMDVGPLHVKVVKTDMRRVLEIEVTRLPEVEEDDEKDKKSKKKKESEEDED